jgi:hypothetical protein
LQTAILVCLAALFCGGVYYAAFVDRRPAGPVAAGPAEGDKPAGRPSPAPDAKPQRPPGSAGAKSADGSSDARKTDAAKDPSGKPPPQPDSPQPETDAKTVAAKDGPPEVLGLYSQRTAPRREEWIAGLGGTPESEKMVAAGLDWLARHQAADGHWGPDCLGPGPGSQCNKDHPCSAPGGRYEAALTGLAVLAFQAGGHYDFNEHQYSDRVARALACLVDQQGFNGELVGSLNNASEGPDLSKARFDHCYMYEHGIATFALAEACAVAKASGHAPKAKVLEAAAKAVRFIESQQHSDGGWRYTPQLAAPSDTSVSGWSMLALKTAREAELSIDEATIPHLVEFFDRELEPLTGRTHYTESSFNTDALTGVGMLVDEFVLLKTDTRRIQLAAPYLAELAEGRWGPHKDAASDYYLWYNCTLAMFQAGGEPWQRWNAVVRDHLVSLQEGGDGCQRGSWPPNDRWGPTGGRIYSTALAILTLEVYYRFAKERLIGEKPGKSD